MGHEGRGRCIGQGRQPIEFEGSGVAGQGRGNLRRDRREAPQVDGAGKAGDLPGPVGGQGPQRVQVEPGRG
jgi:hypothetical protein